MQIVESTEKFRNEWDRVVLNSNDAWLFHLYDWQKCAEEVWGFKNHSFIVKSDTGETLGIFPLYFKKWKIFGLLDLKLFYSSVMGTGGPALVSNVLIENRKKVLDYIFKYVDRLAEEKNVDWIQVELPPLAPANLPPLRENVNPLLFHGFKDISTTSYILWLDKSIDELWANLDKKCRNAVRKAEKRGVKITKAQSLSDIKEYYNIHIENYKRTGAKPHPFKYFEFIWEVFGKKGIANFFFAEHEGEKIAALNVGVFKKSAIYWTGCSRTDYLNLRPNNILQWYAIKWAKEQGCKWYEIGEAFPGTQNRKLAGLTMFKGSFGGEIYYFYKGLKVYHKHKRILYEFYKNFKEP
ncbi:MAG: GNAT family N-acetyltransferase [Candidatus Aenigmatarchaeota archaeon]